jgi:hypothetical protein
MVPSKRSGSVAAATMQSHTRSLPGILAQDHQEDDADHRAVQACDRFGHCSPWSMARRLPGRIASAPRTEGVSRRSSARRSKRLCGTSRGELGSIWRNCSARRSFNVHWHHPPPPLACKHQLHTGRRAAAAARDSGRGRGGAD